MYEEDIYSHEGIIGFDYIKAGQRKRYYYNKNILGDILEIYDEKMNLVGKYSYDAYGNHSIEVNHDGIASINPYRYRSYYYDTETGLYLVTSRYYNPEWCRFLNADSIEYLDPTNINGMNLYAYCYNNPIMYVDPNGHLPKWAAWLISGAAIIGGIVLCATGFGGIAGGVLIGAGAGSLISGYVNEATGRDFTAGYIGGAISGALCGVGAGLGGLAFSAASEVTNLACIGYLALGVTSSFAGGFVGNLAGTAYTSWHDSGFKKVDVNWHETITMSVLMGTINIFAGIGSAISSISGEMGRAVADLNSKVALKIFTGIISGGTEAFYDLTSYLITKLISVF